MTASLSRGRGTPTDGRFQLRNLLAERNGPMTCRGSFLDANLGFVDNPTRPTAPIRWWWRASRRCVEGEPGCGQPAAGPCRARRGPNGRSRHAAAPREAVPVPGGRGRPADSSSRPGRVSVQVAGVPQPASRTRVDVPVFARVLSAVGGDGFVVGGAVGAVGFGVYDRGGQAGHCVDEPVFGIVGDGVGGDHGGAVGDGDFTFGA